MMVYPSMIENAARAAGMPIPDGDLDHPGPEAVKEEFPHWFVYCKLQLGRPITWRNHWRNAKIIAAIPEDRLRQMTEAEFFQLGFDP